MSFIASFAVEPVSIADSTAIANPAFVIQCSLITETGQQQQPPRLTAELPEPEDLVRDEADQRGDDDRAPWVEQRGELVRERLPAACSVLLLHNAAQ